jgi:hypothetical protein
VVAAAVIVVALGSIVLGRRGGPVDLRVSAKVSGTPTPTPGRTAGTESAPARSAFAASGSWTMSSLPSCFRERERIRGSLAQLRNAFPPPSARIRPPAVVAAGDCTIVVRERELLISRGADRLRVPPQAFLYREGGGLTLVYVHGARAEIRRY